MNVSEYSRRHFLKLSMYVLLLQEKGRPANHGSDYLSLSIFAISVMILSQYARSFEYNAKASHLLNLQRSGSLGPGLLRP